MQSVTATSATQVVVPSTVPTTTTITTIPFTKPFRKPDTSQLDRAAYLVGNPIAHSQSPGLHRAIYTPLGKSWGQVLVETEDLPSFIEYLKTDPKCMGSGVTMPYKVAVMPFLDSLTPEASAIGAVNTIFFKSDPTTQKRLFIGHNTDCIGVRDAFLTNVVSPSYAGKPGLVVGGGGTCRAAVYALQTFLGCSPIYIVNRDASEVDAVLHEFRSRGAAEHLLHVSTLEQADSLAAPGAIVSAVPDFAPKSPAEFTARNILASFLQRGEPTSPLLEMCYHPSPDTQISRLATDAGWQVIGGIEAMIGQGLAQAQLWTGIEIDSTLRNSVRTTVQQSLARKFAH